MISYADHDGRGRHDTGHDEARRPDWEREPLGFSEARSRHRAISWSTRRRIGLSMTYGAGRTASGMSATLIVG